MDWADGVGMNAKSIGLEYCVLSCGGVRACASLTMECVLLLYSTHVSNCMILAAAMGCCAPLPALRQGCFDVYDVCWPFCVAFPNRASIKHCDLKAD